MRLSTNRHTLLFLVLVGCGGVDTLAEPLNIAGVSGSQGTLLWRVDGLSDSGLLTLEGLREDHWSVLVADSGAVEWYLPGAQEYESYRLSTSDQRTGEPTTPSMALLDVTMEDEQTLFLLSETASVEVSVDSPIGYPNSVSVELTSSTGVESGSVEQMDSQIRFYTGVAGRLEELTVTGALVLETATMGSLTLSMDTVSWWFLGDDLFFGDLHGHSNLSADACEEDTPECGDRLTQAGEDYFSNARGNGLDFAAITDHAEFKFYAPDGTDSTKIKIWDVQSEHVVAAQKTDFVPILGMEWTLGSGDDDKYSGGHRTVLFDSATICEAYQIGAAPVEGYQKRHGSGYYYGSDAFFETSVSGLLAGLSAVSGDCASDGYLMFSHHTALDKPQSLDWTRPENSPEPTVEMLVEVFSEHGSSELLSPPAEAFGVDPNVTYVSNGSVQKALSMGHRLGFVGGTDNHDGRPGSLDDGPSCPDYWNSDGQICQFHGGALTGILADDLIRSALFSSLRARKTLVTTGPRGPLRALLVTQDRAGYSIGETLAGDASAVSVIVDTTGMDAVISNIELVTGNSHGDITESVIAQGANLVSFDDVDWAYVRVSADDETGEQRIWLSPWFIEN